MAVANCPECQEEVSLPTASEEATVQCPLCGAEYVLSKIINTLPPALIVLDDPLAVSPATCLLYTSPSPRDRG